MKQTPAQIERERNLLRLQVTVLTEEVRRLRTDIRLSRNDVTFSKKEIEKIVLQTMQTARRKNVKI